MHDIMLKCKDYLYYKHGTLHASSPSLRPTQDALSAGTMCSPISAECKPVWTFVNLLAVFFPFAGAKLEGEIIYVQLF